MRNVNVALLSRPVTYEPIYDFLKKRGDKVWLTYDKVDADALREKGVEYAVSYGYPHILKGALISEYRNKIVNIHNAYLPACRGLYPNVWAYYNGIDTGVTLHFIDEGIDTGDIIARKKVPISDDMTLQSAYDKLCREAEKLFFENWEKIITGEVSPVPQDSFGEESFYHNRKECDELMKLFPRMWNTTVKEVRNIGIVEKQGNRE